MKFLKILKEYNQAIIKENQRLKRVYATLVRESEEDNENLDGEEQEFIEPPAPSAPSALPAGNGEDDEDTSAGNGEDDEDTSAGNGEDDEDTSAGNGEEGNQENESDDGIMQSGDEFYGEMNEHGPWAAGLGLAGAIAGGIGASALSKSDAVKDIGKGTEQWQKATDQVTSTGNAAKDLNVDIDKIDANTDLSEPPPAGHEAAAKAATEYRDALKNLDSVKDGAPSTFGKYAGDALRNDTLMTATGATAGGLAGYSIGKSLDKDDEKNVAEAEQPPMTAEEFFGESDNDGWQSPKEFYGESEDHGALTEKGDEPGEELMSAEDFLAGEDGPVMEGVGSAVGAIGGAALAANYGDSLVPDTTPADSFLRSKALHAGLGAGAGYLAGKALEKSKNNTDESEDDELMLAEDFFSDDAEDDGEMIPESDFFAEAAAMKA